jgi:hypothetical protein
MLIGYDANIQPINGRIPKLDLDLWYPVSCPLILCFFTENWIPERARASHIDMEVEWETALTSVHV